MSFLPPNTLPRLTNSPYDDPKVFANTWDATMDLIEGANGASGDSSLLLSAFLKNGRIYGNTPQLPSSPSLGLVLPDGFQWVQDGQLITVDGDTFVGDVPQNFTGYASLVATFNATSEEWEYALTTDATKPAIGSGILAKVTSDTTTVTDINVMESETDVVLTMPQIVARLQSAGGGSGGTTITKLSEIPNINDTDTRNPAPVLLDVESRVETLEAAVNSGGTRPAITDIDQLTTELSIFRQGVIGLAPDEGERSRSANIEGAVDGTFGDGTNGHPDYLDYTTATQNDDGEFEV